MNISPFTFGNNEHLFLNKAPEEETKERPITTSDTGLESRLILYNDDYNSFDFVIESLKEVCRLEHNQAEQITLLAHFKGNATCKKGQKEVLEPMCEKLDVKGIESEVK